MLLLLLLFLVVVLLSWLQRQNDILTVTYHSPPNSPFVCSRPDSTPGPLLVQKSGKYRRPTLHFPVSGRGTWVLAFSYSGLSPAFRVSSPTRPRFRPVGSTPRYYCFDPQRNPRRRPVVWNKQESRRNYWATRSLTPDCSLRSHPLLCSLARSLMGK